MVEASPFLAGEKKLKTGEKMVPRRVVRGGLVVTSACTASFPLGFAGLASRVTVSAGGGETHISTQAHK